MLRHIVLWTFKDHAEGADKAFAAAQGEQAREVDNAVDHLRVDIEHLTVTAIRIPADNRDLNYKKYFVEGEEKIAEFDDYTSHNTERLDIEGIKQLLLKLDYIKEQLDA